MDLRICVHFFIIILLGSIFHLIFGYSMFDIFFKFPLSYGMTPHSPNLSENEIPSNRVAIFGLDGTRADSFFEAIASGKSPFLRDVLENRGIYGVSHAKVPTETKPGFTAMCSGHFEDASLALMDLYNSAIVLDSIFNESDHSWGIGVDSCMFVENSRNMECVPFSGMQDYGDEEAEQNNYLVFDTMIDLFKKAKENENGELYKNLNKKKISFLYHLIQTDTIGHANGPKSERLMNHLIKLDSFYEKIEKAFYEFYQDNRTTFIITADHGMNLNKAHGDGHPDCTRTPFVAWGAGIRKPIYRDEKPPEEDTPSNWRLDKIQRRDISQIDITPLASGIIGISIPMNSLGIIPIDILDAPDKVKSNILFSNLMELYEMYKIKNDHASKSIVFNPYKPLADSVNEINKIKDDINNGYYLDAINKTQKLINITLDGMTYILHYDRFYLKSIIVIGYILWMLYLFIFIEMKNDNNLTKFFFYNCDEKLSITIISGLITIFLCIYLFIRLSPFMYFVYTLFPCYFFWRIIANIHYLCTFFIKENGIKPVLKTILFYALTVLAFLSIVSKYVFNHITIVIISYIVYYV